MPEAWMRWLGRVAGWSFAVFLMVGLPLWVYLDGVGAGCVNDPTYDPHCHPTIRPHDWIAAVLTGGIWWIGVAGSLAGWAFRKVRWLRNVPGDGAG
jgi:hypothetical protein